MRRLTAFSILDCDEIKEEVHHRQIEDIFNKILKLKINECEYEIRKIDDYHSKNFQSEKINGEVEDFEHILERQDFKNGVDVFLDQDKNIIFKVYGQGYEYKGKHHLLETDVIMRFKDSDKAKVSELFDKELKQSKKSKDISL
ncbi:hypothetical protein ACV3RB_13510 [Clostridium perfringens]